MKKTILFQGDSITDSNCRNEWGQNIGFGYATMVAGSLGRTEPYCYQFINKGVSGNRIIDLYARIKKAIINLNPDYMSILIGVNDVWHEVSDKNGVDAAKFEMLYCLLIEEIKAVLPNIKIMIMEPFVLPAEVTDPEDKPDRYPYIRKEVELRAQAAKRVAEKYNLVFVPLQNLFDTVNADAPERGYWMWDGIHPTAAGHDLIKTEWLKAFELIK